MVLSEVPVGGHDKIDEFYIEELDELELDATPAPAPTADDRRRLAMRLAAEAKAAVDRQVQRPKSAMEIIQEALRSEEVEKEQLLEAKRRVASEARARAEADRKRAEDDADDAAEAARRADADRAAFASLTRRDDPRHGPRPSRDLVPVDSPPAARPELSDPLGRMAVESQVADLLAEVGGDIEVVDLHVTIPVALVGPLWHAHQVRAMHEGDLATAWMVQRVRDVVAARPTDVVAARVQFGGKAWAAWFDLDDEAVLALVAPADVYLVGLG